MKNEKFFNRLKAEVGNNSDKCFQTIEQLQSYNAVIERDYQCVSKSVLKKAIRKTVELKGFMHDPNCIKELNALQGHYHKMMNNLNREICCYFQFDDYSNDSEFYL